jgi:hypothetical protein
LTAAQLAVGRRPTGGSGCKAMPRRAAQVTQADIARVIRAAKQAGAAEVVVKIGDQSLVVRLATSSADLQKGLETDAEIIL